MNLTDYIPDNIILLFCLTIIIVTSVICCSPDQSDLSKDIAEIKELLKERK